MTGAFDPARTVGVVVLGMHRSGTSALTRVLNLAGAELNEPLLELAPDNPAGHWESERVLDLHIAIHRVLRLDWRDWRPLDFGRLDRNAFAELVAPLARFLREAFAATPLFAIKDPRLCRLMPLWRAAFDEAGMGMRVVVTSRHPLEVAQSLLARNEMPVEETLAVWLRYVLDAERGSRGVARSWTSYEALLGDWRAVLDRIGRDLGIAWPGRNATTEALADDFLDRSLRHHDADAALSWPAGGVADQAREADAVLRDFAANGENEAGLRALQRIGEAFERAVAEPIATER